MPLGRKSGIVLLPLIQVHSSGALTPAVTMSASVVVADGTPTQVPVMVTVAIPRAAVGPAVNVIKLLPVVGFVPNDAVTPLGSPDAARLTLPVNPPTPNTEMVLAPDAPWAIIRPTGESEIANAVTVRISVVVADGTPVEVPVMVTAAVPGALVGLAVNVRMLLPEAGFVLHAAVTPLGKPDAASVTRPVNPPTPNTEIVLAPDAP